VEEGKEELMGIPKELLEILVCPICKTPVKLTPDNTGLKCSTCRRVYPVRDEIPVMLPEEAAVEKE
jgi:LSD1 subclass zinc finger protein